MRKFMLLPVFAVLAAGCSDSTEPSVATTITVAPAVSMNAVGATQVVRAAVSNQKGKAMKDAPLTWESSSPSVTVTGAGGDSAVVTAAANGTAAVTARSGSAAGSVEVQVAQAPVLAQAVGGNGQLGTVGLALGAPIRVRVSDRLGAGIPGQTVAFMVEAGGGTLGSATAVTGADGIATNTWTLGTAAGALHMVSATAGAAAGLSTQFSATAAPGAPASAHAFAGDNQTAARNTAVTTPPRVLVRDSYGNGISGVTVDFTVTAGGGSVTGERQVTSGFNGAGVGGWTLGPAAGTNTLTASFPGTTLAPVVFTAQALALTPGALSVAAGGHQAAMMGNLVAVAPAVVARNAAGNPIPGITVSFTVTSGGGSVATTSAVTGANGVASAGSWRLGPSADRNTLTATAPDLTGAPVVLRGTGCFGGGSTTTYEITLCITTPMTATQRAAFTSSAARWATVIRGDLPLAAGAIPEGACGEGTPSMNTSYDDLLIFAGVEDIDGPGSVLGQAGWCARRGTSSIPGLPVIGVMAFDAADLASLESSNQLGNVILHEMGHVLGIGTVWSLMSLLVNPSTSTSTLDTSFSGANGIAGFDAIGGSTYTGGAKVPVENTGGGGTMNAHWRESVLRNELMTGFLNAGSNPLSVLTVRSLADLGYTVDASSADPFFLALALRAPGTGNALKLHNDLYTGPRYTLDRGGRFTRTVR
jgi:hypothetical protein